MIVAAFVPACAVAERLTLAPAATSSTHFVPDGKSAFVYFATVESVGVCADRIEEAFVQFTIEDVDLSAGCEIHLLPVTTGWALLSTPTLANARAQGQSPSATWEITPADWRQSGGFVRLDLTDLLRSWSAGESQDMGLAIGTGSPAISNQSLLRAVQGAMLIVQVAPVKEPE